MSIENSGIKIFAPSEDQSYDEEAINYETRYADYTGGTTSYAPRVTLKKGATFVMRNANDDGYFMRVGPKQGNNDGMGGFNAGGTLHGEWVAQQALTTASDVRLKTDINPLLDTLNEMYNNATIAAMKANQTNANGTASNRTANRTASFRGGDLYRSELLGTQQTTGGNKWLAARAMVNQLQPVSYVLKSHKEAKEAKGMTPHVNFGFIAQEVEKVFPAMVGHANYGGNVTHANGTVAADDLIKTVQMQDFIALLVLTAQHASSDIEDLNKRVNAHDNKWRALEAGLEDIVKSLVEDGRQYKAQVLANVLKELRLADELTSDLDLRRRTRHLTSPQDTLLYM